MPAETKKKRGKADGRPITTATFSPSFEYGGRGGGARAHRLSEGQLVDVPRKHGARRQDGGVGGRHDRSRHGTQAEKRHKWRAEVLENDGQDHIGLFLVFGGNGAVCGLVPVWMRDGRHTYSQS